MVCFLRCLLVVALSLLTSALAYKDQFLKLYESQHRVKLLHEQLKRECPGKFKDKDFKYSGKRSIFGSESLRVRIDVENKLGDHLVDLLVECRRNSSYVTTTYRPYYNYTHTKRYRPTYNYTTGYYWPSYNTTYNTTGYYWPSYNSTYNSTGRWPWYIGSYVNTTNGPYYNYTHSTRYRSTYNYTTGYYWPPYGTSHIYRGGWYRGNSTYITRYYWPHYNTTYNSIGRWPGYNYTGTTRYWYHQNTTISSHSTDGNFTSLPSQCTSPNTVSLTELWRNNYRGGRQYFSDAGIYDEGRTWFRFTGKAGSRLINTCPYKYSCGSSGAYWSDDRMPTKVGETLDFYMYESYYNSYFSECKANQQSFKSKVTLCSKGEDYVYLLEGKMSGGEDTLCGIY